MLLLKKMRIKNCLICSLLKEFCPAFLLIILIELSLKICEAFWDSEEGEDLSFNASEGVDTLQDRKTQKHTIFFCGHMGLVDLWG